MLQLILFTILIIFLLSFVKQSHLRRLLILILPLLVVLQLASFITSGNFFDYQAYFHFNLPSVREYLFLYKKEAVLLSLIYLVVLFFFSKAYMFSAVPKAFRAVTVLALLLLVTLPTNSIGNVTYNLAKTLLTDSGDFNRALANLEFENYISPKELKSSPGKNIIVISMESLELGFVENYPELTPNLNNLTKKWTFYNDMPPVPGASWTAGSMYAVQSGLPAFFGMQGNNIFQGVTDKKITTLGDVLNKAGYRVDYIMGNISFAGSDDFLKLSDINTIDQNNALGQYPNQSWGLGDLDVFEEAKLQISQAQSEKPFALFLSTINGHAPNGIYDERMTKFIDNKSKNVDFSVQALDFLVGDFLSFLKDKKLLENTSIFIFPDHQMMGSNDILSTFTKSEEPYRGLYFITNESSNKINKAIDSTLYQYEIPRLIIEGAGIDTNAKFASDYIDSDIINFMKNNQSKIVALNLSGFDKKAYNEGMGVVIEDELLILSADEFKDKIDITNLKGNGFVEIALDRYMSNRGYHLNQDYGAKSVPFRLRVAIKENKIDTVYIGDKNKLGMVKSGESIYFSKDEMQSIILGLDIDVTKPKPKPKQDNFNLRQVKELSITSSEFISSRSYHSQVSFDGHKVGLSRGLNLISLSKDNKIKVSRYDTYAEEKQLIEFINEVEKKKDLGVKYIVAAHDSIGSFTLKNSNKLKSLEMPGLAELSGRKAYIALNLNDGGVQEYISPTSINIEGIAFSFND